MSPKRPLMLHQQECLDWITRTNRSHAGIFMEMRLGKTLAAIRLVSEVWRCQGHCIVVAPVTVLGAWEKELQLEGENYRVIHGMPKSKRLKVAGEVYEHETRCWLLINYDALRATPGLAFVDWDCVILDESTAIKNPKSKISQLCCTGFRTAKHRLALTGLPSPEGDMDLCQQFLFVYGEFLGHRDYYEFRAARCMQVSMYNEWEPTPENHQLIKKEIHQLAYVLRRQDAGVHTKKIREVRKVELSEDQRIMYDELEATFGVWLDRGEEEERLETEHAMVRQTWLARISGGCDPEGAYLWPSKVKELLTLVKGELKGESIVVWFRFNSEIEACKAALDRAGIANRVLVGEIDREEREARMAWFRQPASDTKVLLLQIALAKYGVDVSVSDTAIYYSLSYSGEANAQSEDRIVHPMKDTPLLYVYLLGEETIDEDIYDMVGSKVTSAKLMMARLNDSILRRAARRAKK